MKTITLFILGLICSIQLPAQQATLGGQYNTSVEKVWVINNSCLEIEGQPDAEIARFDFYAQGIEMFEGHFLKQDSCLNERAMNLVYQLTRGQKIYFENIVAYDANGLPLQVKGFYIRIN
jgi:hypothetical protein